MSQFEHYRRLADALEAELRKQQQHNSAQQLPTFIMFSDDDDVWSERRHALYAHEAARASPEVQTLLCRRKTAMLAAATSDDEPRDAAGVRALLSRRLARFTDCNLKDGLDESQHNMAEYFDMAVRVPVLLSFFARVPRCVTRHKLCDLSFCFCFNKGTMGAAGGTVRFMPSGAFADDFVYFYSRGARSGGASGISVLPGEADFGLATIKAAPAVVQRWFAFLEDHHGFGGVALCTQLMASIRQGVEQELIALRATGSVIPLQMCEGACRHQGRLTLESYHMSYPQLGFLEPPVVAWCAGLADGPIRAGVLASFEFEALVCMKTWRVVERVDERGGGPCRSDAQILEQECGVPRGALTGTPGTHVGLWNARGGWHVPPRLLV